MQAPLPASPPDATSVPQAVLPARPWWARLRSRLRAAGVLSLLGLGVGLVLLSTVVQGLVQVERVRERQAWVDLSSDIRHDAESLRARLGSAGRELQSVAVRGGDFDATVTQLRRDIDTATAQLRERTRDNAEQQARLARLPARVNQRLDTLLAVMRDRGGALTAMSRSDAELRPVVESAAVADRLLGEIITAEDKLLAQREAALDEENRQRGALQSLGAALSLGLLLLMAWVAWRHARQREADATALLQANDRLRDAVDQRTRELTHRHHELSVANTRLEELSRAVLRAAEDERRALARELHDDLGQQLAALKMNLQLLRRAHAHAPTQDALDDSVHLVEATIAKVRARAFALRPAELDELGLGPALQTHAQAEMRRHAGLDIAVRVHASLAPVRDEWASAVYRIVQEAIRNALRHGHATQIDVALECSGHGADALRVLLVSDNGGGLPAGDATAPPPAGKNLGLTSMRERAELLGGEFSISARQPRGTLVHCSWPASPSPSTAARKG